MIKPIEFLTDKERVDVLDKIFQLKPFWTDRSPMFCTLGTALYLDAIWDFNDYKSQAEITNKILQEHFSWLYQSLKEVLQKELKEEVKYEESLALPGFHIFSAPQNPIEIFLMEKHSPSIHFDLQFKQAKWSYLTVESNHPISFTASIKLPSIGGGLNYWDIQYEDYQKLSDQEKDKYFESKECHFCPYQEGKIVIHDGFTLHQIAVPKEVKIEDLRITLQGHAVRCDDIWRIYW